LNLVRDIFKIAKGGRRGLVPAQIGQQRGGWPQRRVCKWQRFL